MCSNPDINRPAPPSSGPIVRTRQLGLEHTFATLLASIPLVFREKSSLNPFPPSGLSPAAALSILKYSLCVGFEHSVAQGGRDLSYRS